MRDCYNLVLLVTHIPLITSFPYEFWLLFCSAVEPRARELTWICMRRFISSSPARFRLTWVCNGKSCICVGCLECVHTFAILLILWACNVIYVLIHVFVFLFPISEFRPGISRLKQIFSSGLNCIWTASFVTDGRVGFDAFRLY